jgi:hypothetical protein
MSDMRFQHFVFHEYKDLHGNRLFCWQAVDMRKTRVQEARARGAETLQHRHLQARASLGKEGICSAMNALIFANRKRYCIDVS